MDNAARMPLATMMLLMMLRSRDGDLQARQWYANMVHQHDSASDTLKNTTSVPLTVSVSPNSHERRKRRGGRGAGLNMCA